MLKTKTKRKGYELEKYLVKYIDQIDLCGKKVFIRADLNVPLDEKGNITDDYRLRASLPTINYALEQGARIILASHLGRPKGKFVPSMSLKSIVGLLRTFLGKPVQMAGDCIGKETEGLVTSLKPGEILLLENVRFHPEEEANDSHFARLLAHQADVYINDAFAAAHRAHASMVAIAQCIPVRAGGYTLKDEVEYFKKVFENPSHPLVVIFGGAKISTKILAIKNLGQKADRILIGGAMANTFLAGNGVEVGKSLFEPQEKDRAREILAYLQAKGCAVFLPKDVVVAEELKPGVKAKVVGVSPAKGEKIEPGFMALDIGPATIEAYKQALCDAKTILWNGPMGAFEVEDFSRGTYAIIDILAESKALTVIGGGDTDLALHRRGAFEKMSYVSTAGGAFLELLEGKELPGIVALDGA